MVLQDDINRVHGWLIKNRLPLNLEKTSMITITRKTLASKYSYKIDNSAIRRINETIDLGITFDKKLLFTQIVESTVLKARKNLGLTLRVSYFINTKSILRLYQTNVRSPLKYRMVVWNYKRACTNTKIKVVQKKFFLWWA